MTFEEIEAKTKVLIDEITVGAQDVHERGVMLAKCHVLIKAEFEAVQKEASADLNTLVLERRARKGREAAITRLAEARDRLVEESK